jgi:hypothetical protein
MQKMYKTENNCTIEVVLRGKPQQPTQQHHTPHTTTTQRHTFKINIQQLAPAATHLKLGS